MSDKLKNKYYDYILNNNFNDNIIKKMILYYNDNVEKLEKIKNNKNVVDKNNLIMLIKYFLTVKYKHTLHFNIS
jgi:hypothetical protein